MKYISFAQINHLKKAIFISICELFITLSMRCKVVCDGEEAKMLDFI